HQHGVVESQPLVLRHRQLHRGLHPGRGVGRCRVPDVDRRPEHAGAATRRHRRLHERRDPGPVIHLVTLIPGDGIGPEVADAARRVLDATGVEFEWDVQEAGAAVLEREGTPLPDRVLEAVRRSRTALKGPVTTPVGTGFRSVNVALRQELDLFAAVRPSRTLPGVPTRHPPLDLVVVRENTEDLYAGIEFEKGSPQTAALRRELRALAGYELREDAGVTVKPISVTGTRRIVRFAFDYVKRNARRRVTV